MRNWLFDQGVLPITSFEIPLISIGNLAVGGTGKTPHTEFIINILRKEWKTAMLSRGYKRISKGFILSNAESTSKTIGDEPFQIMRKFTDITVAVDEKRVRGVNKLIQNIPELELVVLDDAFQHRYIQAGLSILLTDYSNLYSKDLMLPAGSLREWKSGSKRANILIVSKCPSKLKPIDMRLIETELKPEANQLLFFSSYVYDEILPVFPDSETVKWSMNEITKSKATVILVAGIVSPTPIVDELKKYSDKIETVFFEDHHNFNELDYKLLQQLFSKINASEKLILFTEKDAARIVTDSLYPENLKPLTYALPIRVEILNKQKSIFIQKIKNYVIENTRNSRFPSN